MGCSIKIDDDVISLHFPFLSYFSSIFPILLRLFFAQVISSIPFHPIVIFIYIYLIYSICPSAQRFRFERSIYSQPNHLTQSTDDWMRNDDVGELVVLNIVFYYHFILNISIVISFVPIKFNKYEILKLNGIPSFEDISIKSIYWCTKGIAFGIHIAELLIVNAMPVQSFKTQ